MPPLRSRLQPGGGNGRLFLRLSDGQEVKDVRRDKKTVQFHILAAILPRIPPEFKQMKVTIDVKTDLGLDVFGAMTVVPCHDNDQVIVAQRLDRKRPTPFVVRYDLVETSLVTVSLEKSGSAWRLISAYWGEIVPPEPQDFRGINREMARLIAQKRLDWSVAREQMRLWSEQFWATHARIIGTDDVLCTGCNQEVVLRKDVLQSIDGHHILCVSCEDHIHSHEPDDAIGDEIDDEDEIDD